jgi:hypothetical protein
MAHGGKRKGALYEVRFLRKIRHKGGCVVVVVLGGLYISTMGVLHIVRYTDTVHPKPSATKMRAYLLG